MHWFYYIGRFLTRVLLLLLTRWQVRGKENIPTKGPLLIVANHLALADSPIIGVSVGRKAMFLAREELFDSRLSGYFVRNFGALPVRRGKMNKEAMLEAEQLLEKGMALIVFPEGRRSLGARLEPAFSGITLIASRSGAPILPIGITGTEEIKGITWMIRRPQITVNIGCPFYLPAVSGRLSKSELAERTSSVMERIAELLPAEYHGNYSCRRIREHVS